jgi:hypothetical protein
MSVCPLPRMRVVNVTPRVPRREWAVRTGKIRILVAESSVAGDDRRRAFGRRIIFAVPFHLAIADASHRAPRCVAEGLARLCVKAKHCRRCGDEKRHPPHGLRPVWPREHRLRPAVAFLSKPRNGLWIGLPETYGKARKTAIELDHQHGLHSFSRNRGPSPAHARLR